MQTTQSPKAGERTQDSTIDPVYGFLNSLRDCTFHFGEDQHELTIKAPDGGKIGLPFVDEMRSLTSSRTERTIRLAALKMHKALTLALPILDPSDPQHEAAWESFVNAGQEDSAMPSDEVRESTFQIMREALLVATAK